MTATDIAPHKVSSWNRQTYQRLKLALSLGLRRQIFVAVCDDLSLRNRLAGKLHAELGATPAEASMDTQGYPTLVSLKLNSSDPNPLGQIAQWLAQNQQSRSSTLAPGFQILGVERLTRQPPSVQRLFLRRLQAIPRNLPRLESTLLLWLPRPWFHMIQQSVPEFWEWHTGIFDFEGEPTPLPPVGASKPEASPTSAAALEESTGSFQEDLRTLMARDLSKTEQQQPPDNTSWKKQHPDNSSVQQPTASETPTDKTGAAPSPANGNPKQTPSSKQAVPLAQGDAVASEEPEEDEISIPLTPHGDFTLDDLERVLEALQRHELEGTGDLGLGTGNKEDKEDKEELSLDAHKESPQFPIPNPQSPILNPQSPASEPQSQPVASLADTYLELGNYYRHAIEQGDASEENLMIAIQAYEQALQWLEPTSPQTSDVLNDLGNLYWMLSRCPGTAEQKLSYLEQGIQAYQLALTRVTAEEVPHSYAMIQNNLGAAYGDLARYKDPADSLEQSIRAYEEALRYRRAENDSLKYASTQNNLGTAYWNLAQHQSPVPNLRAAIAAYTEALCHYLPQSEPLSWAMIQNNLGTAYWNLAQYDQPEAWLALATMAYQDALNYRTPDVAPAACAATQNNLGTAYWHLADRSQDKPQQRADYLDKCIAAYEKAIALTQELSQNTPPIRVNFDVFSTYSNLGLAHYQLATEPQFSLDKASKTAHLEAALEHHVQACTGLTAQPDAYQNAISHIIKTIRAIYQESGVAGQSRALSKVPGQLLPEILPRL
jgi:tetratricopeptide (TPR) repeat protein